MALNLVTVLVNTPEIVRATVDIQHHPVARIGILLALLVVGLHLDPFSLERALGPTPLPPLPTADLMEAIRTQLLGEKVGRAREVARGDFDVVNPHPLRVWYPLAREGL